MRARPRLPRIRHRAGEYRALRLALAAGFLGVLLQMALKPESTKHACLNLSQSVR